MIRAIKRSIHRGLRAIGFDVISIHNIDVILDEREEARRKNRAAWVENGKARTWENPADRSLITDVTAEDLFSAAYSFMEKRVGTVLDIGCGINPQSFIEAKIHICCEPYQEYLNRLMYEQRSENKYIFLRCGIEDASRIFPPASVDTICLIDVIEHLERKTGEECLTRLKAISRSQLVIFTPIGFMPQEHEPGGKDPWGMGGVEWQEHRSGWLPEDFPINEGWKIVICPTFHTKDAYGRSLENPIGAMWAIWTRREEK